MKRLPVDPRDRDQVRERRSAQGADPGRADAALHDGRHPDQRHGQVVAPRDGSPERGRATVSTRWANAPACRCTAPTGSATNSLLDLMVFGRAAGKHIVEHRATTASHKPLPADAADRPLARLARLDSATSGESVAEVANDLRRTMQAHCGVFRNQALLSEGLVKVMRDRRARAARCHPGQEPHLQYRTGGGARALQPDRGGQGHDRIGRGAPGKPRRPGAQRLSEP